MTRRAGFAREVIELVSIVVYLIILIAFTRRKR